MFNGDDVHYKTEFSNVTILQWSSEVSTQTYNNYVNGILK